MRYGNAAWGFRETPLEKQLKITRDMGLDILELGIANAPSDIPLNVSEERLLAVRGMFEKYGVDLICASTGNDFTTGSDGDVGKIKRTIDICEQLGVQYLRIFAGFSSAAAVTGTRWETMIACLREVGEYAWGKVVPVIETHGGVKGYQDGSVEHFHSVTTNTEKLKRLLSELPENIMFLYDPANLWAVGYRQPSELLKIIGARLAVVHLKDFVTLPSGRLRPAACGESNMNWAAELQALSKFDGPALFEYENTQDVAEGSRRCYEYICGVLG